MSNTELTTADLEFMDYLRDAAYGLAQWIDGGTCGDPAFTRQVVDYLKDAADRIENQNMCAACEALDTDDDCPCPCHE